MSDPYSTRDPNGSDDRLALMALGIAVVVAFLFWANPMPERPEPLPLPELVIPPDATRAEIEAILNQATDGVVCDDVGYIRCTPRARVELEALFDDVDREIERLGPPPFD